MATLKRCKHSVEIQDPSVTQILCEINLVEVQKWPIWPLRALNPVDLANFGLQNYSDFTRNRFCRI